jgi:hypothetical protein
VLPRRKSPLTASMLHAILAPVCGLRRAVRPLDLWALRQFLVLLFLESRRFEALCGVGSRRCRYGLGQLPNASIASQI